MVTKNLPRQNYSSLNSNTSMDSGNNISSPRLGSENPWICVRPLSNFYMYCVYAQKSHVSTCFIYTFLYIGNGAPDITKVYLLQQCVHTRQTYMYSIYRHLRHICIMINARNIFAYACIYMKSTRVLYTLTILALTDVVCSICISTRLGRGISLEK